MKRLLLIGGGHAHLHVLARLAAEPVPGWQATLLTPQPLQVYSGMLPGWVAGHYALDECRIDLRPLAARAGVELRLGQATALDAAAKRVAVQDAAPLAWDALSLDVGSAAAALVAQGAAAHAVPLRPVDGFVASWQQVVDGRADGPALRDLVIVGAGAGGVELAFAMRRRAERDGWHGTRVHLVGAESEPLPAASRAARTRALQRLHARGIHWHGGRQAVAVTGAHVVLDDGTALPADRCWAVTGPAAHPWLRDSGLRTDAEGFVQVDRTLCSVSHPEVFAAGDVASHAAPVPKSGVYAVRAGPVLARNLIAHLRGTPLRAWTPQSRALHLLATGDGRAMGLWGGLCFEGRWVWRWKDRIDRRFVASFGR